VSTGAEFPDPSSRRPWPADRVERWPIDRIIPYPGNPRVHSEADLDKIAASIRKWGWTAPPVVDEAGVLIVGHVRVAAAAKVGLQHGFLPRIPKGSRTPVDAVADLVADAVARHHLKPIDPAWERPSSWALFCNRPPSTSTDGSTDLYARASRSWPGPQSQRSPLLLKHGADD